VVIAINPSICPQFGSDFIQCGYIPQFCTTIIQSVCGAERAQEVATADRLLTRRTAPSWTCAKPG
jgi:hypothetical protein